VPAATLGGMRGRPLTCAALCILLWNEASAQPTPPVRSAPCPQEEPGCAPPAIAREFRGVWVATVGNMDWPSRPGLPSDSARLELARIIEYSARIGLNAILFQIRPAGDALYSSKIEPWSEYLTGKQGMAPDKSWDPLSFAVREAHARGLELHAWFNPYRAKDPTAKGQVSATHFSRQYPAYAMRYGRYTWFDPGEPNVRKRTVRVVMDVLNRYDIDGVHVDDYFYPYPEQRRRREIPFPDTRSFERYRRTGGRLDRDDWRRQNVDLLVDTLRGEITKAKPWVKFGVSPFGIWRPGEPATVTGFDAFGRIYADARKWLSKGWVDYLAPQLYWGIEQDGQRFGELLRWWHDQNDSTRHIWPGLAGYKINAPPARWRSGELLRQIDSTRTVRGATGAVHFQFTALFEDRDSIATRLLNGPYAIPALVPAMPWKGGAIPRTPAIAIAESRGIEVLVIGRRPPDDVRWWAIQSRVGTQWRLRLVEAAITEVSVRSLAVAGVAAETIALTPVSRTGVAGAPIAIRVR
jgi:uncharacterized lipoprotein YddW (UPF0748 family)